MSFDQGLEICAIAIAVSLFSMAALLWILRRDGPSLGIPFAYLAMLALNHVPGAAVPLADHAFNAYIHEITIGISLTALGMVTFVLAVWHARRTTNEQELRPQLPSRATTFRFDMPFWIACLLGGWLFTFGLSPLRSLPSVGAVVYNGATVWMLGVMLGLRWSIRNGRYGQSVLWLVCLSVYPILILLTWGFLSYGAAAVMIVICVLVVSSRGYWRNIVSVALITYIGLSFFSNYFILRDNIRDVLWSNAKMEQRVNAVSQIFQRWKFFDTNDQLVLLALDLRLNQNVFVGLAARNLEQGNVEYLNGSSVTDAILSVIPRAIWPNKTVYGGSPEIVSKMAGVHLQPDTSFGVGNVMEFYINFGVIGLIGGFFGLGWALGRFDHRAALAEHRGDYGTAIVFFLPAVAMIQPLGSMVELAGSAASAWIAAHVWRFLWRWWQERRASPSAFIPASLSE